MHWTGHRSPICKATQSDYIGGCAGNAYVEGEAQIIEVQVEKPKIMLMRHFGIGHNTNCYARKSF